MIEGTGLLWDGIGVWIVYAHMRPFGLEGMPPKPTTMPSMSYRCVSKPVVVSL
jgi:hypothetical protein